MPNPLNPLDWVKSAQDWFAKTERSSGFRPYLIFFLIHAGLSLVLLIQFKDNPTIRDFVINTLYVSVGGFVIMFAIKSLSDPTFCRSEKHIETVKRIETMEQKGDLGPTPVIGKTIEAEANPAVRRALSNQKDHAS
jgi:hypothetical protein